MSDWVRVLAKPIEPVAVADDTETGPAAPEYWKVRVQKSGATGCDGVRIVCGYEPGHDDDTVRVQLANEIPRAKIARQPVGTVLHTFKDIGPLKGTIVISIDRFGGLQAHLHYPTLAAPYQLNML